MARVTVEDCLKHVKNRFELVMLASKRARQLMHGATPKVEIDHDKATVVALREIAEGYTDFTTPIIEEVMPSMPSHVEISEAIIRESQAEPPQPAG